MSSGICSLFCNSKTSGPMAADLGEFVGLGPCWGSVLSKGHLRVVSSSSKGTMGKARDRAIRHPASPW